jgi:repressor LexA
MLSIIDVSNKLWWQRLDIRLLFADTAPEVDMALTRRQRQIYDFIAGFVRAHGYSPSFEEIAEGVGLSSLATVHKHVTNLEKKGLLKRDYNRSRSIDILPLRSRVKPQVEASLSWSWPLVGRIAAGRPVEAVENRQTISMADFTRAKDVFVLEVRGDSMQDEHILDGDYVLVEKTASASNGEIVVALCSGSEATLKRFFRDGEQVRLQPANSSMQPILLPASQVEIQGRVIGVMRKY